MLPALSISFESFDAYLLLAQVSEEDEADMDRFAYVMEDTLVACEVATKLAGMLTEEELALTSFTFFLLGADVRPRSAIPPRNCRLQRLLFANIYLSFIGLPLLTVSMSMDAQAKGFRVPTSCETGSQVLLPGHVLRLHTSNPFHIIFIGFQDSMLALFCGSIAVFPSRIVTGATCVLDRLGPSLAQQIRSSSWPEHESGASHGLWPEEAPPRSSLRAVPWFCPSACCFR